MTIHHHQTKIFPDGTQPPPDAVIILGSNGLIDVVNEQTERLFGYARDELHGQKIETLVPERLRASHENHREGFQANPTTRPMGTGMDLFGRRKDGSEFPIEIGLSPIGVENGRQVICVVRDVAQQKNMEAELRRMLEERRRMLEERHGRDEAIIANLRGLVFEAGVTAEDLRASIAVKDEFVSMVSHELRNPITTILGNSRVLIARPGLAEEDRIEALKDIEQEGRRLQATIEDLLILARPENSEPVPIEPIFVHAFVDALVNRVSPTLPSRTFRIDVEPGLMALGHPEFMEHVLLNLIANATKYSAPEEPIEIEAKLQPDGSAIEVSVLDRGPGVKKEDTETIFDLFYRAHSTMGLASGMGIGLSVCKRLMEKQGGRIWVEERQGGGSAFRVVLPRCLE